MGMAARGSLVITRPVLSHYLSNRSEIDAAARSLFDAVARGVVASHVAKTFPLRGRSSARVHRRPKDKRLDRHAPMITRYEIRRLSDENRGQPIISQAVVHGNVAYLAGITPDSLAGDIKAQTARVLRRVDELLALAGTDKSQILSAQVWIADMRLFEDHNSVWNEWVDPANPPVRACLTTDFWRPGILVEVMVVAAVPSRS
jgi:enamine deaminase RidA (YjgF/YER057c/UK114 family)